MKSDHKLGKAKAPTWFYDFRHLKQLKARISMIMSYHRLASSQLSQFSLIQLMRSLPGLMIYSRIA